MGLPTSTRKIIASGAWVQVRVKENDGDSPKVIGLCTEVSYDEDFNLQEAHVLGLLGPASIDSQGYRCNINIGVYIPENPDDTTVTPDGGSISMHNLMKTRSEVMLDGKGKTFSYLDFYNKASQKVIEAFSHAVISRAGGRSNATGYLTSNIGLMAIERTRPASAGGVAAAPEAAVGSSPVSA
jgi:hypothetical protein